MARYVQLHLVQLFYVSFVSLVSITSGHGHGGGHHGGGGIGMGHGGQGHYPHFQQNQGFPGAFPNQFWNPFFGNAAGVPNAYHQQQNPFGGVQTHQRPMLQNAFGPAHGMSPAGHYNNGFQQGHGGFGKFQENGNHQAGFQGHGQQRFPHHQGQGLGGAGIWSPGGSLYGSYPLIGGGGYFPGQYQILPGGGLNSGAYPVVVPSSPGPAPLIPPTPTQAPGSPEPGLEEIILGGESKDGNDKSPSANPSSPHHFDPIPSASNQPEKNNGAVGKEQQPLSQVEPPSQPPQLGNVPEINPTVYEVPVPAPPRNPPVQAPTLPLVPVDSIPSQKPVTPSSPLPSDSSPPKQSGSDDDEEDYKELLDSLSAGTLGGGDDVEDEWDTGTSDLPRVPLDIDARLNLKNLKGL